LRNLAGSTGVVNLDARRRPQSRTAVNPQRQDPAVHDAELRVAVHLAGRERS
jgi:hypothetical protein